MIPTEKTNLRVYRGIIFLSVLIINCVWMLPANAQKRMIRGYVRDSATHAPISNARVANENSRKVAFADNNGFFSLSVSFENLLLFNAPGYRFDTILYNRPLPDTVIIFMKPLPAFLPNVTVTTTGYNQYQIDSIKRRNSFVADVGGPKMQNFSKSNSGAGIALNLDAIFKKKDKSRRNAYHTFNELEKTAYVNYRFSPELVAHYTGLKNDSLTDFMTRYNPGYEWLRSHTSEEDIMYYINDKLKLYFKRRK